MKKNLHHGLVMALVVLALAVLPRVTRASVPHTLTQQGRLFDANDKPVTGKVDVTFAIYGNVAAAGADALWTEAQSITFDDGWFSVSLGEAKPIGDGVLTGEPRWLGIKVGSDEEMFPRAAIRSVPYAFVAENAIGDITPKSVGIAGVGKVIDENGKWVGDPSGLVGPMGPEGPGGSADTPAQVLAKFNQATLEGGKTTLGALDFTAIKYDIRWAMQHAAANAACAAASPVVDSPQGHVVIPHQAGATCTYSCANNTSGAFTQCRTSIAIGNIRMTQATAYSDVVGENYNYGCNDSQARFDETLGQGLQDTLNHYTAYCCCYL